MDLTGGQLTYTAEDGEVNKVLVDVTQQGGVDYVRLRETGSVSILVQEDENGSTGGLVVVSAQEVLAPSSLVNAFEITTGDMDDTLALALSAGLPAKIVVSTGPAVAGDVVTVFGTSGDDAIALSPGRLADGTKAVALSENGAVADIAVAGLLNIDLSQNGSDSLTVDRSITGYGHAVDLNVVGGGDKPDTMSVVAPGTVPQTLTLADGHVRADDAATGSELLLGRSDNIAIDQPKVTIEVIDTRNGDTPIGPDTFSTFLLDTGATSILAAAEATAEMEQSAQDQGIPFRKYDIPYLEQGVAGYDVWDVSKPYRVDYAGNSGVRNTLNDVQFLNSEDNSFSFLGPWGIVGMPAMVDKVTTLDLTKWHDLQDPEDLSMTVDFSSSLPAPTGHQYTIPLHLQSFPNDGQQPGGPVPISAPLPFVHVKTQDGGYKSEGQFLVDTGAQLSMISTATAIALGLDRNHNGTLEDEALDHIEVGGVGGTVSVPLLSVDRASITTDQGPDMVWTDLLVGVIDITSEDGPQIDGIFGMDYLTSGWASKVLNALLGLPGQEEDGYFQHISFDFRDAANMNGSMILDVTPERDVVTDPQLSTLNISYTNINSVSVLGGDGDDTFNVTPSTIINYVLDGGGQYLGDQLNLVPGVYTVDDDGSTARITGYKDVQYSDIEYKNFGGAAPAGVKVVPTNGLETTEAGGTASFTVVLSSRPTTDVSIAVSSSDETEGTVSTSVLTFTPDDWYTPQTVVVTGVDDSVDDGDVAYSIVLSSASSDDPQYSGLDPADVSVVNADDDLSTATVTVATSQQGSAYGQELTFTATVGGAGETPSGTIQFVVDGVDFGDPAALASGSAVSLSTALLGAGNHVVQAFYSGDGQYAGGDGAFTQTVVKAGLAIIPDDKGRQVGQANPALTYQLVGFANGEDATSAGVTGSATLTTTAKADSPAGTYPITVSGSGTLSAANYEFPSGLFGTGTLTVTAGAASVIVGSTLPDSTYGQSVSFMVTVDGAGPVPTGTVQFVVDGAKFGDPVALVSGAATSASTVLLGAGSHVVTANYLGDSNYATAGVQYSQDVAKAALEIVPDDKSRQVGQANPTLTYTLVGFVNGEDATSAGITGIATLATAAAAGSPSGTYPITLSSSGTLSAVNYDFPADQYGAGTLTVTAGAASVVVGSTLPDSTYGNSVSFTVTVAAGGPVPTGTVQFLVDGAKLGDPVVLVSGAATSTSTALLGAGGHVVSAEYSGDANYAAAGAQYTQDVAKATPVLTWDDPADIVYSTALGSSQLDATASVSGTFAYTPVAGTVLAAGSGQSLSVVFTPDDSANYESASKTVLINVLPLIPPTVQGVVVNDGSAQRSMVTSLTVTIHGVVDLAAGSIVLQHRGGGDVPVSVATSVDGDDTIVVLTFSGSEVVAGSLADGRYILIVHGELIHDAKGVALDGDDDGGPGGDYVDEAVFRLYGDSDGDGDVDNSDVLRFKSAYKSSAGQDGYIGFLDFNGDGVIDLIDFNEIKKRYGKNLFI